MGVLDFAVLGAYFVGIVAVGLWFGRGERNTNDYFLGGRKQHWFLAGVSIIATEVSALTYVGVPADSFRGDWTYLQMYFGSFVGRVLIVFLLLPAFYGGAVTTVYEYLGQRFGPWTRTTAALMFFVSRILGSGIRLLAGSMALAVVFDWPLSWVVIGSAGAAILYASIGGIKAILWTDLFQASLVVCGALAVVVFIFAVTPGGWWETLAAGSRAGKFHIFIWDWNPNNEKSLWVLFCHATVLNMAALGCDQDLTQRMLTCRKLRQGQKSLMFNALAGFPIVCLFLLIGVLLFLYFQSLPAESLPQTVLENKDRVFPFFIANALPANYGLRGLVVTAIFAANMSTLASAVGALSSSAVTDFYRPFIRRFVPGSQPSETHFLRAARGFSLLFGVLLIVVAMAFAKHDQLLWEAFKWASLLFGSMLGAFLLGVLTRRRGSDPVNTLAMLFSVAVLVWIKLHQETTGEVYIAWPWWVVIGTIWTFGFGACFRTTKVGTLRPVVAATPTGAQIPYAEGG